MTDEIKLTRAALKGINKDIVEVALYATELGWTASRKAGGGFQLHCPCGQHYAYVPLGTKNGHIKKSLEKKINDCPKNKLRVPRKTTRTRPEVLASPNTTVGEKAMAIAELPGGVPFQEPKFQQEVRDAITDTIIERAVDKHTKEVERLEKRSRNPQEHLSNPISEALGAEPVLVSEKPHMAKRHDGKGGKGAVVYPSEVVTEQTWSDGKITYRCTLCGYGGRDQTNHRSVANHAGVHRLREKNREAQKNTVVIPENIPAAYKKGENTREYHPSERLVSALADALHDILARNDGATPDEVAQEALVWMHERPDLGDPEDRVREPLDDAGVLNRIRSLVDGGRYGRLEQEIVNLQVALQTAEEARVAAEQKAERLSARLASLAEQIIEDI